MNRCLKLSAALGATMALAGCVGYGYPGDPGYGTYPSGSGYGSYPPAYPGGYGYGGGTVRCESDNGQTRHCNIDTRGGVQISRRLSDTQCVQGRNWGYDASGVWVSGGCRAEFVTGTGGYGSSGYPNGGVYGGGQVIRCESNDGRRNHCNVAVRSGVQLVRNLSDTRCVQGGNWGWDRSGVWVDNGCRGEFQVY